MTHLAQSLNGNDAPPGSPARSVGANLKRYERGDRRGVQLRLRRGTIRVDEFFADLEWGGPEGALREAIRVRDALLSTLGPRPRGSQVGPHRGGRVRATSGVRGTYCTQAGIWYGHYYYPKGTIHRVRAGRGPDGFARACEIRRRGERLLDEAMTQRRAELEHQEILALKILGRPTKRPTT